MTSTVASQDAALEQYEPQLRAEAARRWLGDFCEHMNPSYQSVRHQRLLCDHLQAVERGDIKRLIVSMPPRHGKTLAMSQYFPAWYLGRNPSHQLILASYGGELAEANSRVVRNLLTDSRYPFRVGVAKDSSAVNRWATDQGGIVIAVGVGGAMTGFGGSLVVLDDLVKGREEADSDLVREKTWQWYLEVARTRLMPGGAIIMGGTRWHEDDCVGRVLNSSTANQWTVLEMPALDDDGHALWPEWFNEEMLAGVREELGSRAWSALYMQRPTAAEGGTFKHEWMRRLHEEKTLADVKFRRVIQTVDSAFKVGSASDYSVIETWGTDGVDYYLLDIVRKRVEFPELVRLIAEEFRKKRMYMQPSRVYIEDSASGQSAIQVLKRSSNLPVLPTKVKESKESRAEQFAAPLFEAGKVSLPKNHPLLQEYIAEMASFPTGRHDDMVDPTSAALRELRSGFGGDKMKLLQGLRFNVHTG